MSQGKFQSPEKIEAVRAAVLMRLLEIYNLEPHSSYNVSKLTHTIPKHPLHGYFYDRDITNALSEFYSQGIVGARVGIDPRYKKPTLQYFIKDEDAAIQYLVGERAA